MVKNDMRKIVGGFFRERRANNSLSDESDRDLSAIE